MTYSILKADLFEHKDELFSVWEENYPGVLKNRFKWIYKTNPAGPASVWLIKHDKSGKYVGATALFRREFVVDGKSFTGGIAGDLVVSRKHRTVGPAVQLQKSVISEALEGDLDFVYVFPNKSAAPVLRRVGYKKLGQTVRLVKVLKTRHQVSKLPFGKYWGYIFSPVFDLILRIFPLKMWFFKKTDSRFGEVKDVDHRFDLMFEKASQQFIIMGLRSSDYLRWKFLDSPNSKNYIFAMYEHGQKPITGYVVYRRYKDSIEIRDFLFLGEKRSFYELISAFLKHARSLGAESITISILENRKVQSLFKDVGFIKRAGDNEILFFVSNKVLSDSSLLETADNWFLLRSEDDM